MPTPIHYHSFDDTVKRWAAIRTRAHWEKKTANLLHDKSIAVFLPTMARIVKYKTRTHCSYVPLFPGYVFFDETELSDLSQLSDEAKRCIVQVLRTSDQAQLQSELKFISTLISNHKLIQEKLHGKVGEVVRVKGGSFAGFEGKIIRRVGARRRLVIDVSYLGSSVEVELDEHSIEKARAS